MPTCGTDTLVCAVDAFAEGGARNSSIAVDSRTISMLWNLIALRYLGRKSQPSVTAAQWIAWKASIHSIAASQLWSYGDKLYLGDRMAMSDLGTPPEKLSEVTAD